MAKVDGSIIIDTKINTAGFGKGAANLKGQFGNLGSSLKKLSKLVAAAFSVKALVDFGKQAIELGSDLQEVQNVVDVTFTTMNEQVNEFARNAATTAGLSETMAKQYTGTFGAMAKSFGFTESEAYDMSTALTQLSGDVASFYNLSQDEAYTKLKSVFTGETESLKDLGVVMTQTALDDFALRKGLSKTTNQMSEQEKVALRYQFIMDQLSGASGDFVRTQDGWANQTRVLNLQFEQLKATIGQGLINVLTPVLKTVNNLIGKLQEFAVVFKNVTESLFGNASAGSSGGMAAALGGAANNAETLEGNITKAGKAAKKAVAGFDELNVLSSDTKDTGETVDLSGVGMPSAISVPIEIEVSNTGYEQVEKLKETINAIVVLIGTAGAGILAWKILDAYTAGVKLSDIFKKIGSTMKNIGSTALIIAGAVLLIKGYCDAWVNGLDWKNLLLVLGGIAAILTGVGIKFGTFGVAIAAVAAGIALVVLGVKDFIANGPKWENIILIIGGAIAIAVGLATAGLSVLVSAIIAAVSAVAAFTAAILLEEPAIMSTKEAQEKLTAAKEAAAEAENGYINAVDAAEASLNKLKDAEERTGLSGAELYKQVQDGTLDYANMTDAQKEVYKAYLDNEKKQKELEESTKAYNEAKKAETLASYENQLALAKESGSYDEFKKSVVEAFEKGELSADEARELIGNSMSEMSDDAQKTFMEDLPGDIKKGLDPSQYETTRKKLGDWFKSAGKWFIESIWEPVKKFWKDHIAQIFTTKFWSDLAKKCGNGLISGFENAINGIISMFETMINWIVGGLNKISFDVPDWVPLIGGKKFGFNIPEAKFGRVSIPRLAQGAVIPPNREFMAVLGDQRHGTNIEAPLDTIKQALAEVMATQGAGDVNITFTGDLAQLARVLKPVIDRENRRVGGSLIKEGAF